MLPDNYPEIQGLPDPFLMNDGSRVAAREDWEKRRQEIKNQLEIFRKTLGGSNLDFEKAMAIHEQIDFEKERLEKANASVLEVEQKISEIEENA